MKHIKSFVAAVAALALVAAPAMRGADNPPNLQVQSEVGQDVVARLYRIEMPSDPEKFKITKQSVGELFGDNESLAQTASYGTGGWIKAGTRWETVTPRDMFHDNKHYIGALVVGLSTNDLDYTKYEDIPKYKVSVILIELQGPEGEEKTPQIGIRWPNDVMKKGGSLGRNLELYVSGYNTEYPRN